MSVEVAIRGSVGALEIDIAFTCPRHQVTALIGPSGAGKTTILRWLAGLERLDGTLVIDGETWQGERTFVPAHRRRVGMVFQRQGLLPHLSVRDNLGFAVRRAGAPLPLDEVVAWTGIASLLDRSPARLSGGEAQRAAIARALIGRPRLLLLDEPLSALDGRARAELATMLETVLPQLDTTVILVSHDLDEVARLARRVIQIEAGRLSG